MPLSLSFHRTHHAVNCPSTRIPHRTRQIHHRWSLQMYLAVAYNRLRISIRARCDARQFPLTRYRKFTNVFPPRWILVMLNIARNCERNDYAINAGDSRAEPTSPLNVLMYILIRNHTRPQKRAVRARNGLVMYAEHCDEF